MQLLYRDANANSEEQIKQIKDLVNEHIDLLIVSPNEAQPLTPIVEEVFSKGIPVIVIDRKISSAQYTAYIGANNYEVGKIAGQYSANLLNKKGTITEVLGLPGSSPAMERHKGFMDALKDYPSIKVTQQINGDWLREKATAEVAAHTEQVMATDLVFAHNDMMAKGTREALQKNDAHKKLKIIGIDGLPINGAGLDMVGSRFISATVLYPTGGQEAILTAANILEHRHYEKENQLFTTIIDSINVRIMKLQNDKLLEQEKNIDRSQQKIEEQKIIANNQSNIIYAISVSLAFALIMGSILFYYLRENRKISTRLALQNEQIITQRDQLIELGKKAKDATDAKINFFTNISHEFRTPLTLILGPLEELLNNAKLHFTTKQYLTLIQKNTIRLLRLVNELIDFRKIEVNKMQLQASENNLVQFANDIIEPFKTLAKKKDIDLRVITKQQNIHVWFDHSMLDKVMFNLLSNAFKFTNDNGFIHITLERNDIKEVAIIKVEDNGIGMSQEVADHAFELFYQANITNQQGSGLGLSLSKELITLHHGMLTVTSRQYKGTCFEIQLPLGTKHLQADEMVKEKSMEQVMYYDERIYTTELDKPIAETEETPAIKDKGENYVLIIEDNPDLRNFLADRLGASYQVLVAENGVQGLQQAFDNIPDLIISDVIMPEKDGLSITNILKTDFKTSHIPIILLTAKIGIEEQIEGMKSMADAYILKPFNLQFLEEAIHSLLKNREVLKEHYTSEINTDNKSQSPKKLDRKFINEFTSIIEMNLSNENFSVEDICKQIAISRVQLYRKVKALLGVNVNDFILNMRLQKAKHYLLQSEFSVSEIAYKVGFATPSYFSTVFKNKMGVSPASFKKGSVE